MTAPVSPAIFLDAILFERQKRAAENQLREFVKQAWHVVEPGVKYVESWHIDVICEHLEAVTFEEIQRLLINIPPRHSKSTIVSVMWPAWEWITHPEEKFLCASYSGVLSIRDNLKTRRLITSPWYQERWGHLFRLTGDQNAKQRFENDKTGYRIATSVGGTATGEGGSRLVLDDPHGAQEAQSEAMRLSALEWFDQVWTTRLNTPKRDAMVTIMQRLHEDDVSGRIIQLGGWEHVCIPAEYDGVKRSTVLGTYEPRERKGELICPDRFGPAELAKLKIALGEYGTAGQLQQQPSPKGGGILKTKHFQIWRGRMPDLDYVIQSYDTAFDEKTQNDPSACTVWGCFTHKGQKCAILLDAWDERLPYPKLRKRVLADWRSAVYCGDEKRKGWKAEAIIVEKKASGQSILQDLQSSNIPAFPYEPGNKDKIQRAHNVAPILEMDILYIPESTKTPGKPVSWAEEFLDQVAKFPNAKHDDYVDTLTQVMIFLRDAGYIELPYFEGDPIEERDYHAEKLRKRNPYGR